MIGALNQASHQLKASLVRSRFLLSLALLWLIGIALRLAILAVPPVIPALRDEFHLSGTAIGMLSGVPIVMFALAALVGSRLVARIGVVAAAVVGLMLTALGSAGRGGARAWRFCSRRRS